VYRVRRDQEVLGVLQGSIVAKISLKGAATKAEVLDRIEKQLMLPEWFGRNWDALEDCLKESGGVLLFYDYQGIAADDLGVLLDVLRSSAEFCAGEGDPFFAIFVDPDARLPLPDLFRET
jgi:hypothetical protein